MAPKILKTPSQIRVRSINNIHLLQVPAHTLPSWGDPTGAVCDHPTPALASLIPTLPALSPLALPFDIPRTSLFHLFTACLRTEVQ